MQNVFMTDNKYDFYKKLLEEIHAYMEEFGLTKATVSNESVGFSRRQYFYIANLAEGRDAPELSEKKLNALLDRLNLTLQRSTIYKLSAKCNAL